jgi:hypothetical protein
VGRRFTNGLIAIGVGAALVAPMAGVASADPAAPAVQSWPDFRNHFLKLHRHYLPEAPEPPGDSLTHAWVRWQGRYFEAREKAMARIRKAYLKMKMASAAQHPRFVVSTIPPGAIRAAVLQAFGSEGEHALAVLQCENPDLNPNAIHQDADGTSDWGLFQINIVYNRGAFDTPQHLLDPLYNIAVAESIYRAKGWGDWTCGRLLGLG